MSDAEYMATHDIPDDEGLYTGRASTSYDDFVGGNRADPRQQQQQSQSTQQTNQQSVYQAPPPHVGAQNRTYSQTSVLDNYNRYYDDSNYPEDEQSSAGYHYASAGDNGGVSGQPTNNKRSSMLSMGGGLVGRVKSAIGLGPHYSEMDLPLTDRNHGLSDEPNTPADPRKGKKFDPSKFKFGFGRKMVDPASLGPRVIHLNNPPANAVQKYLDNHVSTAKYNVATFVPKFLYEQFSKYANLFFLFTAILQQIPNISPTNRYTTIAPLTIVLLVSAAKELVEDWRRKTQDKELNRSRARVLIGTNFEETKWINVRVGDIVRVESEEPFPADLVLLASSEPEGLCYIETANLDGETNLKIKQAIPETSTLVSPGDLSRLSGRVRSEQPNSSLYTYEATLSMNLGGGEKELPLSPEQLLLRGATLRNTPWIHGIVVFTGHETKLMRNATATPIKRTNVERLLNRQILMLVGILLLLSLVSSTGDVIKLGTQLSEVQYLYLQGVSLVPQFFKDILTYWVLYSNLVPIR